jgi:hypothetical protein
MFGRDLKCVTNQRGYRSLRVEASREGNGLKEGERHDTFEHPGTVLELGYPRFARAGQDGVFSARVRIAQSMPDLTKLALQTTDKASGPAQSRGEPCRLPEQHRIALAHSRLPVKLRRRGAETVAAGGEYELRFRRSQRGISVRNVNQVM